MTELERQIQAIIAYIYTLSPEVRVEAVDVIYEDEHANLKVYPPLIWDEERCLDFQEQISEYSVNILVETGYLILVYVYMPEQQIDLARHKLALAQQQQSEADQILIQATALGIA